MKISVLHGPEGLYINYKLFGHWLRFLSNKRFPFSTSMQTSVVFLFLSILTGVK